MVIYTLEKAPEYSEFQSTFFFLVPPEAPDVAFAAVDDAVDVDVDAVPAVLAVGTADAGSGPVNVATGCVKAAANKKSRPLLVPETKPLPPPPPPPLAPVLLLFVFLPVDAAAAAADGVDVAGALSEAPAAAAVGAVEAAAVGAAGAGAPSALFLFFLLLVVVVLP